MLAVPVFYNEGSPGSEFRSRVVLVAEDAAAPSFSGSVVGDKPKTEEKLIPHASCGRLNTFAIASLMPYKHGRPRRW